MATILINGVYHTSFREGGGGAAGMDILELSTATGTLTSAQLALVQSDHCIIKYSNNYYYKSYHSTNGCDYVRGTFTKTNASVTDYYFTCDFSNSEFTFGSNADERARVVANPTLGSGESATPLQNIRVAGTAYSIPAISTDVLADKTSNTKTASPKAVYDAVMALAGNESYVTAWDGESAPVAANIPAGVTVTYSGQTTTGSLAASENTDGKIYLVSDTNGNFYRYLTQLNGSTYSWVLRGTTELDLSDYATKEELSQLDQKIDDLSQEYEQNATPDYVIGSMSTSGVADTSSSYGHFAPIELKDGHTIHLNMGEPFYHGYNVSCLYKTDAQGNFVQNLISGSGTVAESYKNESGTTMYVGVSAYKDDLGYYITGPADKATNLLSSIYGWIVSEAFTVSSASYTDGTINSPVSVVWPDNYPGTLTIVRDSDGNVSSITATHGTDSFVLSVTRDANGNVTKTEIN